MRRARGAVDKGQSHQIGAFLTAVRTGGPMPIALGSLLDTTNATLAVTRSVSSGRPETL